MFRERFVWIGLAALLVIGLVFAGGGRAQQGAWMEGYTVGRLTAAAGVNAAVAPVAPVAPLAPYAAGYPMGYPHQGPGFGGFLFLLFGAGALLFVFSRFAHLARWRAWAMQQDWSQGGAPGEWRGGPPPWMRERMHGGCGHHHQAPNQQPEQAPVQQPNQTAAPQTEPEVKPAADR